MLNLTLNLSKKTESHLNYLETISKRSKSFYIEKALTKYLEDLGDLYISLERLENKEETYTTDEALAIIKARKNECIRSLEKSQL